MSALENSAAKAENGAAIIEITAAKFLIKSIRFHESSNEDDSLDFRTSAVVAVLNFNGLTSEIAVSDVRAGNYDQVSFLVHKVAGNETPSDPDFVSGNNRYSSIIEGLYNGVPFVYRSAKTINQVVTFPSVLVVEDLPSTLNVTLQLDTALWFVDNHGAQLNPTDTSNGNVAQIDQSIHRSFRVFRDTNRDGHSD